MISEEKGLNLSHSVISCRWMSLLVLSSLVSNHFIFDFFTLGSYLAYMYPPLIFVFNFRGCFDCQHGVGILVRKTLIFRIWKMNDFPNIN